jgi:hypothetical protein
MATRVLLLDDDADLRESLAELIRIRHDSVERIDRALARLRELSHAMARERGVAWPPGGASFDPRAILSPKET